MGIISNQKNITPNDTINCDGTATIRLELVAGPDITSNPVDIMLVLDRSMSMEGASLAALKVAANAFIDIIDAATNNGDETGTISGGSTIGITRFNEAAQFVSPPGMTADTDDLKAVINGLVASGFTCHACAFQEGRTNFDPNSPRPKIMVLFTDGVTTTGSDPNVQANLAKAAGIEIYAIGLGNDIDEDNLHEWASEPSDEHVIIAPTIEDLREAFEQLAENITKTGATNIVLTDTVYDDFEILDSPAPVITFSNVTTEPDSEAIIDDDKKSIRWTISELGIMGREGAVLEFTIQHVSDVGGNKLVNREIEYEDDEGNIVNFENYDNEIFVDCPPDDCVEDINVDCCIEPETINMDACEEFREETLPLTGEAYDLLCAGRLLSLHVRLRGVCPQRKVAVGVIVYEVVDNDLVPRGFRAVEVEVEPLRNQQQCTCRTINIGPFDFVLPEEEGLCNEREFRVKVIAHYSDSLADYNIDCDNLV